jgi:hypothetical protein
MQERRIKRHDDTVTPWARFLDEAGVPIDLTGCTVRYTVQDIQTGETPIVRAPTLIRDQTSFRGEVFYQFTPADVATALYGSEEWEVTYPDGRKETFPVGDSVTVIIQPDLDNT